MSLEMISERPIAGCNLQQPSLRMKYLTKNADIYKMHTYKDAILRTQGAYILYPGYRNAVFRVADDEAIQSVGAFPLTPGKDGNEEDNLRSFIMAILRKRS